MTLQFVATQLFVGESERRTTSPRDMTEAIRVARELAGIDALIVWPCSDRSLLGTLVEAARSCGMRTHLWFPVLADPPDGAVPPDAEIVHFDGTRGHGASGAWPGLHGGAEDFLFACPNNQGFLQEAIASLDALVDLVKPDGVMLDRIRYPSPANGLESLFSCFCPACQALFTAETGLPLSRAREDARELLGSLSRMDGGDLEALRGRSVFPWVTDGLAALARFRADSVLRATRCLSTRARERGLAVGLDLFSPSLAGLVGQDYPALAGICDWIKPMTYCRAVGPAGLPLELASLRAGLAALAPRADGASVARLLSERFGWDIPDSPEALLRDGFPARVIATELESIRALGLPARVAVYAGIEAVSNPAFGIDIRPDDLEAALSMSAGLCQGVVASWNLLSIPRESLRRIGALRT